MAAVNDALAALQLKPQIKPNVDIFRHVYRGEVWYLFHDRAVDRYYRVSAAGSEILGAMDGRRTLSDIHDDYNAQRADDATLDPQQLAQFIVQLNALGLLRAGLAPAAAELEKKNAAIAKRKLFASLRSPLALRIPLIDPTPILRRLERLDTFLFSPAGIALWSLVVLAGTIVGALHWGELTIDITDHLLSLENLAIASLVYPFIKVIHEFAHALVLRHYGGEVRRMGVIIVGFMPVPYVDASSSIVLSNKHWRMMVGAAGIMAELFVAALAILGWALAEPSILRTVCYDIVMISGLSTLLFNGNPLQRYDGYYILCDLVEIPGLGMRASQQMLYYVRRHLLGDTRIQPPQATPGERLWFLIYGPASFVYRIVLVLTIVFYVMRTYPLIGTALGIWTVLGVLWTPVAALARIARLPSHEQRRGATARIAVAAAALAALLFLVPIPSGVVTAGVVSLPDETNARPKAAGEIVAIDAKPGSLVAAGAPLLHLANAEVTMRVAKAKARLAEMEASLTQALPESRVKAAIFTDKVADARKSLAEAEDEAAGLVVRSPASGRVILASYPDLLSRYLNKGEVAAVIWSGDAVVIRAMVPMADIDRVRQSTGSVAIRFAYAPMTEVPGHIQRIVPAATDRLPSPVLSLEGGGPFAVAIEPSSKDGRPRGEAERAPRTSEAMFEVDIQCDRPLDVEFLNGMADVRFDLGWEPIGFHLFRSLRLVFLRYMNV